jgi:hypothetical protein
MSNCFPFIKYVYLSCLFIVAFMCTYSSSTEMIGYSSIFALQTVFTISIIMDILLDKYRSTKVLHFPNIPNNLGVFTEINVPIWWVLLIGAGLQFVAALLTMITSAYLYKRFQILRMSQDNHWRLSTYRNLYITCTVFMMILMFTFLQFGGGTLSPTYTLLLILCFVLVLILSPLDVYYSNRLSKIIGSTTDG